MSDTRFTASNGWYVDENRLYTELRGLWGLLDRQEALALAEYGAHKAQAERDAALGRWRSVERPDWVVYPGKPDESLPVGYQECVVVDERDGNRLVYGTLITSWYSGEGKEVAREFFAAHPVPEPKPWEDAGSGELWSLMTADGGDAVYLAILADDFGMEFVGLKDRFSVGYTGITAGRRIWPEVSA